MKDSISDMIIRIQNASVSKKESVVFPYSKLRLAILDVLLKEGFIKSFSKKGKKVVKYIEAVLSYDEDGNPRVSGVKRISKTSKRIYQKSKELKSVKSGYGIAIVSTSKGIMTDKGAKAENLGGEVLFTMW